MSPLFLHKKAKICDVLGNFFQRIRFSLFQYSTKFTFQSKYYNILFREMNIFRPQPRITLEPAKVQITPYTVSSDLIHLNNNWAAPLLQQTKTSFHVNYPKPLDPPQIKPYHNEYLLSDADKTVFSQRLESSTVEQFLNRSSNDISINEVFELKPISSIFSFEQPKIPFFQLPPPLSSLNASCLHVVPSPISVHGSVIKLSNYRGCLFLFDQDTNTIASEAAYFQCVKGQLNFCQATGNGVFFEVKHCKPTLLLVIILMHSNAKDLDSFIERITSKGTPKDDLNKSPLSFAYSFATPFKDVAYSAEISFNFPWAIVRPSDKFSSIGDLSGGDFESISLIGKASIRIIPFECLPQVSLTSKTDNVSPLLALSIPQRTFFPTSIISLSSISFSFNKPPKGDYAIFRVYLCNDICSDPIKPESLPVFISRNNTPISNCYESVGMIIQKHNKIVFPDVVRLKLDKPLKQTANIIIHFLTASKDSPSLYKLTAFPLFGDGNIISSANHSFFTQHSKDLKNNPEYLLKCKQTRHSFLTLNIDIPQVFYPPQNLVELSSAIYPEQVQWESIRHLPPEILLPQLIPIIAKLFSLISQLTAEYLLEFLSMFEPLDSNPQIRSWLYHNFDPNSLKPRFLSSFANSLEILLQRAIEKNQMSIMTNLAKSFDIISDILISSYMLKMEEHIQKFLYRCFLRISDVISYTAKALKMSDIVEMNAKYGATLYIFLSETDKYISDAIRYHIKKLIDLNKITESSSEGSSVLLLIWDFLIPFTETKEFALYLATHFPVKPISINIFSPFYPTLSIIYRAVSETFLSHDTNSINLCCIFLAKLCLPLEDTSDGINSSQMMYRMAYAFYPILDLISSAFEKLDFNQRMALTPAVLFLMGYSPQQLLSYHFISFTNMKNHFIKFLENVVETILKSIGPENYSFTFSHEIFCQLTERILPFLNFNVKNLGDSITPTVDLLIKLSNSPYQISTNYPRLFDTLYRVIAVYPCQRALVVGLLAMISSKQHLVRCFATSLILLFFKSDYDLRKSVVVSSVEVLDSVTGLMLHSPRIEDILMYKMMFNLVLTRSERFNDPTFTQKLSERIQTATNIANIIEKLRRFAPTPEIQCIYVMQIADQYKTYPSMRVNWLRELVQINTKANCIASAFVAQLHICVLIATVIQYNTPNYENMQAYSPKENKKVDYNEFKKQFNFLVCQPISSSEFLLSPRFFEFFPSTLIETQIDFDGISEDFKFISSDFTLQYLTEALSEAIQLGKQAKLYYSLRPLYSLQLRIKMHLAQYKEMGSICQQLSELFNSIKANKTTFYNTPLCFFVVDCEALNDNHTSKVYTIDCTQEEEFKKNFHKIYPIEIEPIKVYKHDVINEGELENQHCWTMFRTKPSITQIEMVQTVDKKEIQLIQYTTQLPLPCFMLCSNVIKKMIVEITLLNHVQLEVDHVKIIALQIATEFERFFPCKNISKFFNKFTPHFENELERISSIFDLALFDEDSIYKLLRILSNKGGFEYAVHLAQSIHPTLEEVLNVFRTAIDVSKAEIYNEKYDKIKEFLINFQEEFQIEHPQEYKPYEGSADPLLEQFDFK